MISTSSTTAAMERVVCPLCHARAEEAFLTVADRFNTVSGQEYRLVKCQRCDLVYLNPRPVEAFSQKFYEHAGYSPFLSTRAPETAPERLYVTLRRHNNRWKRKQIEKVLPQKGKILDVGCGTGEFLAEMRQAGWDARGVEPDAAAVAYAIEQLKLRVYIGGLAAVPNVPESYDVITMWHVLEHLYDPHQAIQRARDLLKKGGVLIIAVPNVDSLDRKLYKKNWIAFDAPRHVQHFSLKTLRMLCEMHKFEMIRYRGLPLDSFFNALMSEEQKAGQHRSLLPGPLRILRAGIVAKATLLAGAAAKLGKNYYGSTLLTFWRKA